MNWNEAAGIDWGTIILFGCGIAIGTLMSETGFAEVLGTGIADALGGQSLLAISAVSAPPSDPAERGGVRLRLIPITTIVRSGIAFDIAGLALTVLLIPLMARLVGFV